MVVGRDDHGGTGTRSRYEDKRPILSSHIQCSTLKNQDEPSVLRRLSVFMKKKYNDTMQQIPRIPERSPRTYLAEMPVRQLLVVHYWKRSMPDILLVSFFNSRYTRLALDAPTL